METADEVDQLYSIFNQIKENQASGKSSENPALMERLLSAAAPSGSCNAKRLAAQFVCRLFPAMPQQLQARAYEALLDLLDEEDDQQTRRRIVAGLPELCRGADSGGHATKVADVLTQLLQTDDEQELSQVQHSLLQVLNTHAAGALAGIFGQVNRPDAGAADPVRLRAAQFLGDRLLSVDPRQMTPRVEEATVAWIGEALEDVSEEEFGHFVRALASLQCMQTLGGRQRLLDTVCAQAGLADSGFEPGDPACLARVRGCASMACRFLSRNIIADKFVCSFLDQVLPHLDRLPQSDDACPGENPRLDLLRSFAELCGYSGPNFKATDGQIRSLLSCINTAAQPALAVVQGEQGETAQDDADEEPNLDFSEMECLLVMLHTLGGPRQDYFLTDPGLSDLAETKKRLHYFQLANQSYEKSIQAALSAASAAPPSSEPERRLDALRSALAATAGVGELIRRLLKRPPEFADSPSTSWRRRHRGRRPQLTPPEQPPEQPGASRKRRAPDAPTYRPPVGKFSRGGGAGAWRPEQRMGGRSRYYNVYTAGPGGGGGRPSNE